MMTINIRNMNNKPVYPKITENITSLQGSLMARYDEIQSSKYPSIISAKISPKNIYSFRFVFKSSNLLKILFYFINFNNISKMKNTITRMKYIAKQSDNDPKLRTILYVSYPKSTIYGFNSSLI